MTFTADMVTADGRAAVGELLRLRGQTITLIPAVGQVTNKPSGGKDYAAAAPRAPQKFALFNKQSATPRRNTAQVASSQTDKGTVRKLPFEMIGAHDAVIGIGDKWEDASAIYEVETVDNTQPYQVKAVVVAFLKVTGHSFG